MFGSVRQVIRASERAPIPFQTIHTDVVRERRNTQAEETGRSRFRDDHETRGITKLQNKVKKKVDAGAKRLELALVCLLAVVHLRNRCRVSRLFHICVIKFKGSTHAREKSEEKEKRW